MHRGTPFLRPTLTLAALVLMTMAGACGTRQKPAEAKDAGPTVLVAPVLQKTVPVVAEMVARTDATASVDLVARVEGFLLKKSFQEGAMVEKDQVLYQIDPAKYDADVLSAKAQIAQAKANLVKAKQDVERYKPLAASHAIPDQQLDQAVAAELVDQANVQVAEAGLVEAQLNLSYCTIRSPFRGIIGKNQVDEGNLVGHGQATVLNTVSVLNPIKVTFGVPEAEYLKASRRNGKGLSPDVQMILADNTVYPLQGRLRFVNRAVDIKTGTLEVTGDFPNPSGLIRPNQFARVRMVYDTAENALLIPQKCVIEQQGAKAVYVVGPDNKVLQRTVTLGPTFENLFIVKEGLKAGERVIVEGLQKARPGAPVTPMDQPAAAEP